MTALDEALARAAAGGAPDTIALMRILMEAQNEAEARSALAAAQTGCTRMGDLAARARLDRLAALWDATPEAWAAVHGTASRVEHHQPGLTAAEALAYWAEQFDRLVAAQPEASVALYSLGRADLLAAATTEIVERMVEWDLIWPTAHVLDLGCGIGRFLQALAPLVERVVGLDLSAGMVAEARRRCSASSNVSVRQSGGRDLAGLTDRSFDLVLAADVFPYVVAAGGALAERHVAEAARVLRPGGVLLLLNYSYRGDEEADRKDVADLAHGSDFAVERLATHDFVSWDGATFLLRRRGGPAMPGGRA